MNKTWQDELDRLEINDRGSKGCSVCLAEMMGSKNMEIIYQFITDLRKQDEKILIEILPFGHRDDIGGLVEQIEQLIKDYYAK